MKKKKPIEMLIHKGDHHTKKAYWGTGI